METSLSTTTRPASFLTGQLSTKCGNFSSDQTEDMVADMFTKSIAKECTLDIPILCCRLQQHIIDLIEVVGALISLLELHQH